MIIFRLRMAFVSVFHTLCFSTISAPSLCILSSLYTHLTANFALSQARQVGLRGGQMRPLRVQPQIGVEREIVQDVVLHIVQIVADVVVPGCVLCVQIHSKGNFVVGWHSATHPSISGTSSSTELPRNGSSRATRPAMPTMPHSSRPAAVSSCAA